MPIEITDPGDERVRDYFTLTDVALRTQVEPARGLYLAESEKVIRRSLAAGHRPRSFLMAPRWITDLSDVVEQAESDGVPVYFAQHAVIEAMTGFHLHRGALASMHRPALPAPEVLLQNASRVVVLEDIVDHTNVGAVFRSAAALGVDAVLITPRCADVRSGSPWAPCSRCPGHASTPGPAACRCCGTTVSPWRPSPWVTGPSVLMTLQPISPTGSR